MAPKYSHSPNDLIWMQPYPGISSADLRELVENAKITATPRLGVRTSAHSRGYAIGADVTLRVFNETGLLITERSVIITQLIVRQLGKLRRPDLAGCGPAYRTWRDVQRVLGFFERRTVKSSELVTIVRFAYHQRRTPHGTAKP